MQRIAALLERLLAMDRFRVAVEKEIADSGIVAVARLELENKVPQMGLFGG